MGKFKELTIRDFTHQLAKSLLEGGEIVILKGGEPYRYLNIRPVKVVKGGILSEEKEIRSEESKNVGEEVLLVRTNNYE